MTSTEIAQKYAKLWREMEELLERDPDVLDWLKDDIGGWE